MGQHDFHAYDSAHSMAPECGLESGGISVNPEACYMMQILKPYSQSMKSELWGQGPAAYFLTSPPRDTNAC